MNRLKLLTTATLASLVLAACDEGSPPPVDPPPPPTPVGTISGTVTIEGTAAAGVTATLSSGASATTGAGGDFSFSGVEAGTYTVTISGYPEDATFAQATQSATIATDGENVRLSFAGEYVRSSAVVGAVVASDAAMSGGDGQPETLSGVTVTLGGEHAMGETARTGMDGGFAFTGLRAGRYTVEISGYPEDVTFETKAMEVEVEAGEVGNADFTGHYVRTSAVEGRVAIEGEGLAGVTVTLSGGPAEESRRATTDADGMYRFGELRAGAYEVSIAGGFEAEDYEFASTSRDVSVEMDETATVSFTGVLLRTSGISGRVSVEGMGLSGVEVTLSGADEERTETTDASGQYAFTGLAAGDYAVSIGVEGEAYVFGTTSMDVTVADDESKIVNFEGEHATTASVSGMAYVDEGTKNDMFDEGEHALMRAGIPVALVGPGVNEQRLGATDEEGGFSFEGLKAGSYQLVVLIDADASAMLAKHDVAYGGPSTGYVVELGVGEAATRSLPFDITHTTVDFEVKLKSGEALGDALPDAKVSLYADMGGENMSGSGVTDDEGMASIRVARAGTTGHTVYATVVADGYSVDMEAGKQAVKWDPQEWRVSAKNVADVVNMKVDVSVSGKTVKTELGGGVALGGWAIGVTSGEETVEGAPKKLDEEGMAKLETTAESVPTTYAFMLAKDQEDELDGGEKYESEAVEYTHTGLKLAGETMEAGTLEASYATQTLKVYVHHEKDQVEGYTGNVLGGDERAKTGYVDVSLRYMSGTGRSRSFTKEEWDSKHMSEKDGVVTFLHVPTDYDVVVRANESAAGTTAGIKLLEPDELEAYRDAEANGLMGGAFGSEGGFGHTVSLCPLQETLPQDHDECASFAYVTTHSVKGEVWRKSVTAASSGDGFSTDTMNRKNPGVTVDLTPVEGKNLAGEAKTFAALAKDVATTKTVDETYQFDFGKLAAGAYEAKASAGWRVRKKGGMELGTALSPLSGAVELEVTPSTGTVYGRVKGSDGFPIDSATVTANGKTAMTDLYGRYVIAGVSSASRSAMTNKFFVKATKGATTTKDSVRAFVANGLEMVDIAFGGTASKATVSGKVTASGSGAAVAGAEIQVQYSGETKWVAPENKASNGKLVTGADGSYMAEVKGQDVGGTAMVRAMKKGMSFAPESITVPAHTGAAISGINFTGFVNATITGRVKDSNDGFSGPVLAGFKITVTKAGESTATDSMTTGETGVFTFNVPFGAYDVAVSKNRWGFVYPNGSQRVSVAPGESKDYGTIDARTWVLRNVSVERGPGVVDSVANSVGDSVAVHKDSAKVLFRYTNFTVAETGVLTTAQWGLPTGSVPPVGYEFWYRAADGNWRFMWHSENPPGDTVTTSNYGRMMRACSDPGVSSRLCATGRVVPDDTFSVRVISKIGTTSGGRGTLLDADTLVLTVPALDPVAKSIKARRSADNDTIQLDWVATTNERSHQRIVWQLAVAGQGGAKLTLYHQARGTSIWDGRQLLVQGVKETTDFANFQTESGGAVSLTAADLQGEIVMWIEARQSGDPTPWKMGPKVTIAAVSSGSG